jgi:hypothetical protein
MVFVSGETSTVTQPRNLISRAHSQRRVDSKFRHCSTERRHGRFVSLMQQKENGAVVGGARVYIDHRVGDREVSKLQPMAPLINSRS